MTESSHRGYPVSMEEDGAGRLQLSLGGVVLQAPETPQYLAIAAQILEIRRGELEAGVRTTPGAVGPPAATMPQGPRPSREGPERGPAPAPEPERPEAAAPPAPPPRLQAPARSGAAPQAAVEPRQPRRGRWFQDQLPQVTMEDGSTRVLRSLEEVRALLSERGLQPHPRGDASMLLWQVRNRLGLAVDAVPRH